MTTGELRTASEMWASGVPVKQMAHLLGYSTDYLYWVAARNRERFPRRHAERRSVDAGTRELWVGRVRSGEARVCEAARACGVTHGTIGRWARSL